MFVILEEGGGANNKTDKKQKIYRSKKIDKDEETEGKMGLLFYLEQMVVLCTESHWQLKSSFWYMRQVVCKALESVRYKV